MTEFANTVILKTTIWKNGPHGKTLVMTLPGLPFGELLPGETVDNPAFGRASCSGVRRSGAAGPVSEIELTVA